MKRLRQRFIKKAGRIVVKVGSAVVAGGAARGAGKRKSTDAFRAIAEGIGEARKRGREAALVSSGAIAMGLKRLGISSRHMSIPERQAVAALGQGSLMALYDSAFSKLGMKAAQILLTQDDLSDRRRFLNARNTLFTLFRLGVVPVINENDTVAVEEIKFGDNDNLSALVTNLIEADLLIILTDMDGVYDRDPARHPDAERFSVIENVDRLDIEWTEDTSDLGTGGIRSKLDAARKAAHFGAATVVASGFSPGVIAAILDCEDVGTLILPREDRLTSRKHWIAFSTRPTGRIFVDDGAKEALVKRGKSLLPSGIKRVDGSFDAGEVIHCVDLGGMEFARGLVNYSSAEIDRIKGLRTSDIEKVLGYRVYDEVIHRDNLVVL